MMLNDTQTEFLHKYLGFVRPRAEISARDLENLRKQFAARGLEATEVAVAFPEQRGALDALVAAGNAALAAADIAQAKEALFALVALLKSLSQRGADLAALAKASPVTLGLAAVDWRTACDTVAADVDSVREAVLAEIDDPDAGAQAGKLGALAGRLRSEGGVLTEAVRAVVDAGEAERASAARAALATVEASLSFISGSPILAHLLAHPLDADVPQRDQMLVAPLTALRKTLASLA
jgi:hypothetical protein